MKPLKDWDNLPRGYRFGEPTWYSAHHLGLDLIAPFGTEVYAPFDGEVSQMVGEQGGNTVWFSWDNLIMRVMHLSRFGKDGQVKMGDVIGYVGSTGSASTGNHAHTDISKNTVDINNLSNFLDPEKYSWGQEVSMGFSEANMLLIINRTLHKASKLWFKDRPENDVQADINSAMTKIKTGNVDVMADILENYANASDNQLMNKTDCKVTDCYTAVANAKDELNKEFEAETKKMMDEHSEEINQKIADAVAIAVKDCQEKATAGLAYYSAFEKIKIGLKELLGIK